MAADRDQAAAVVAAEELLGLGVRGRLLVVDEPTGRVVGALRSGDVEVTPWLTRAWGGEASRAEPIEGTWEGAVVRLSRERARLQVLLHLVAARLPEGAPVWVVGANDEGIRSTAKCLQPLFEEVRTVATRRHCRLLTGLRTSAPARGRLADHFLRRELVLPGVEGPTSVVSLPGAFARGGLDPATRLLLTAVADLALEGPALDFATGLGLVALGVARRRASVDAVPLDWTLCDVDTWSLAAAQQNLPRARVAAGSGWQAVAAGDRFGVILSNPPLHRGVAQDTTLLDALVAEAPARLRPGGSLVIVSQRTAGVGRRMQAAFGGARVVGEDRSFCVWAAGGAAQPSPGAG